MLVSLDGNKVSLKKLCLTLILISFSCRSLALVAPVSEVHLLVFNVLIKKKLMVKTGKGDLFRAATQRRERDTEVH